MGTRSFRRLIQARSLRCATTLVRGLMKTKRRLPDPTWASSDTDHQFLRGLSPDKPRRRKQIRRRTTTAGACGPKSAQCSASEKNGRDLFLKDVVVAPHGAGSDWYSFQRRETAQSESRSSNGDRDPPPRLQRTTEPTKPQEMAVIPRSQDSLAVPRAFELWAVRSCLRCSMRWSWRLSKAGDTSLSVECRHGDFGPTFFSCGLGTRVSPL